MVSVSVIVCTYNRAESLRDTLKSLMAQRVENVEYEVIVVDNNSKDQTKDVVTTFNGKVRYLFEYKQGLSYARNTGIKEAKGDVIAFTDDDVIVDSGWVEAIWKCFHETAALAVGGKIERLWHCERPDWLTEELTGPLIVQDLGPVRKKWDQKNRHMIGANMAFNRALFEKYGFFKEELGRRGDELIGGEDRELFRRLFEANIPIFYEPKAVVHHKIEKERLTKEYMRKWFWDVGKTLGHGVERKWYHILTVAPLWLWKKLFILFGQLMKNQMNPAATEAERFTSEIWLRHYWGMICECFVHWLPFGVGRKKCAFGGEFKHEQSK